MNFATITTDDYFWQNIINENCFFKRCGNFNYLCCITDSNYYSQYDDHNKKQKATPLTATSNHQHYGEEDAPKNSAHFENATPIGTATANTYVDGYDVQIVNLWENPNATPRKQSGSLLNTDEVEILEIKDDYYLVRDKSIHNNIGYALQGFFKNVTFTSKKDQ